MQVINDAPPLMDDLGQFREIVFQGYEVGDASRGIRAGSHRDGTVRGFQGQDIVHPIASHRDFVALFLNRGNQGGFLFGVHATEHGVIIDERGAFLNGLAFQRNIPFCVIYPNPARDFRDRDGVVPGDDANLDAVILELRDVVRGILFDVVA